MTVSELFRKMFGRTPPPSPPHPDDEAAKQDMLRRLEEWERIGNDVLAAVVVKPGGAK